MQKQPVGQITKSLSSPSHKNIPLNPSGKSALPTRAVSPNEGRLAIVTNVRWDAVDAMARLTSVAFADGEVVWSWRPDAGAKFCGINSAERRWQESPVTGESSK